MYPTIRLGSISISSYLLMWTMSAVTLMIGLGRRALYLERDPTTPKIIDVVFHVVIGSALGSWVATNLPDAPAYLLGQPLGSHWWAKCANWFGILGGGSLAAYVYCLRCNLPPGRSLDLAAPVVPLVHAVGRVGCLLAGCCYGRETTSWPSLVLPDIHGVWASRYPTRIVSISANILISITIFAFERYRIRRWGKATDWPFAGFLYLLYILLFCSERFLFEFWRADMRMLVGPFTWNHLYCAIGIGLAAVLMVRGFPRDQDAVS